MNEEYIKNFLEVATALDPCFKQKMDNCATVFDQIKGLLAGKLTDSEQVKCHSFTNIYCLPLSH